MEKLLSLSPFSSAGLIHDGRSEPKLWRLQAETLIRELNLIPKEPVKIVKGTDHALPRAKDGPRLVEKPFEFPNFDVSVEDLGHHAGYHQIADSYEASMFYFFFESRKSTNDPVVIWLTEGPGCSSELAIFFENGRLELQMTCLLFGMSMVGTRYFNQSPLLGILECPYVIVHSSN